MVSILTLLAVALQTYQNHPGLSAMPRIFRIPAARNADTALPTLIVVPSKASLLLNSLLV